MQVKTAQLSFSQQIFADDPDIAKYKDPTYQGGAYVPVEVTFQDYSTTFLNDLTLSLEHFVILDEIAIDQVELKIDDNNLGF